VADRDVVFGPCQSTSQYQQQMKNLADFADVQTVLGQLLVRKAIGNRL
jgi:hypothetical protein